MLVREENISSRGCTYDGSDSIHRIVQMIPLFSESVLHSLWLVGTEYMSCSKQYHKENVTHCKIVTGSLFSCRFGFSLYLC